MYISQVSSAAYALSSSAAADVVTASILFSSATVSVNALLMNWKFNYLFIVISTFMSSVSMNLNENYLYFIHRQSKIGKKR